MPAYVPTENNSQDSDSRARSQSATPRIQTAPTPAEPQIDAPRPSAPIYKLKAHRDIPPPSQACSPAGGGGDFVESLLSPVREWLGGPQSDYALCSRQPQSRAGLDVLVRADGGYSTTRSRPDRRGLADDNDCGCGGGGRKCAGCAVAWDAEYQKCPICGSRVGAGGRGMGCDGDGARRGVTRGFAPPVPAPTVPARSGFGACI